MNNTQSYKRQQPRQSNCKLRQTRNTYKESYSLKTLCVKLPSDNCSIPSFCSVLTWRGGLRMSFKDKDPLIRNRVSLLEGNGKQARLPTFLPISVYLPEDVLRLIFFGLRHSTAVGCVCKDWLSLNNGILKEFCSYKATCSDRFLLKWNAMNPFTSENTRISNVCLQHLTGLTWLAV